LSQFNHSLQLPQLFDRKLTSDSVNFNQFKKSNPLHKKMRMPGKISQISAYPKGCKKFNLGEINRALLKTLEKAIA